MRQALDWMIEHAFAIIGGSILFVAILAAIAYASKQSGKANEKASENKDPREGE